MEPEDGGCVAEPELVVGVCVVEPEGFVAEPEPVVGGCVAEPELVVGDCVVEPELVVGGCATNDLDAIDHGKFPYNIDTRATGGLSSGEAATVRLGRHTWATGGSLIMPPLNRNC